MAEKDEKLIELDPREYRAPPRGEKQPFFGDGLWPAVGYFSAFLFVSWFVSQFVR